MTDPLMVVITSGSQREVVTAYRDALHRPHRDREFWLKANEAIIERWSIKALGRIKREAWKGEFYGDAAE